MPIEEKLYNIAKELLHSNEAEGFKVVGTGYDEDKGEYVINAKNKENELTAYFSAYTKEEAEQYEGFVEISDNCYVDTPPYTVYINGKDIWDSSEDD